MKKIIKTNLFDNANIDKEEFEFLSVATWNKKELLAEEFKSIGFYLTDHPLNQFEDVIKQLNIDTFDSFYENDSKEGLVAGTIMSIQEKKSAKGTPYAIVKFSDKKSEFELFLFAEVLVSNREILKESETFALTLQKDIIIGEGSKKRINVRKILKFDDLVNKPYNKVTIELKNNYNLNEIKEIISNKGETQINLIIRDKNKRAFYLLKENRKFDLNHIKALKAKNYVEKITVQVVDFLA